METKPGVTRVAVDTKLSKFGVDTKFKAKVRKFCVETKPNKFGVETNPGATNVAVDTKLRRLGVDTTPEILETYPSVPRPIVVEVC